MPTNTEPQRGLSLAGLLVILGIIIGLVATGALMLSRERARVRDAVRLMDMTQFSAAMHLIYSEQGSYASAAQGCPTKGALMSSCTVSPLLASISQLKDPGRFAYLVAEVPDADSYAIVFNLEQGYQSYGRGQHVLTQDGIR
jgi:hypothetical protein